MSLYQRKDSPFWWIKLNHNGRRIQESTGTTDKVKAQELHDRMKASLWDQERLGVKPRHSWQEAVVLYLRETGHKASSNMDQVHLKWLDRFLGTLYLDEITRPVVDQIRAAKLQEGVKPSTANRTLEVVRAVLNKAVFEWEWLDKAPRIRMQSEPDRRIRWLTREEAERLLGELPPHLEAMARFSLETGLRQSNVTGLQWSQVNLDQRQAWIHADQAKARKPISVPLSSTAVEVIRQQLGKHETHVFCYQGKPVIQTNTKAWRSALARAGIENFRWHDLRHTWASWHAQAGTPLHVLQELGAWQCVEMVRRYAHLSGGHLAEYVDRMSGLKAAQMVGVAATN